MQNLKNVISKAMAEKNIKPSALARELSKISSMKLTPQAVNSWVKTGRVDKKWFPFLSELLGFESVESFAYNQPTRIKENAHAIPVPRFDIKAKCGTGLLVPESEHIIEKVWITPEFIRRLPIKVSNPNNLSIIEAYDHSMDPTIADGDLLLIDNGINAINSAGIYALLRESPAGLDIMIKRGIPLITNGFIITSDNKTKDHIEYRYSYNEDHPIVAGRVVWNWRGIKL